LKVGSSWWSIRTLCYQLAQSPAFVTAISSAVKSMSPSDVSTIAKNSPTLWKEIIKQGFIGKATGQY